MIFVNLFFAFVNGWLFLYFLGEEDKWCLTFINALAFGLNLIPVVARLM